MAAMTYAPSRLGEGFFIDVPVPGSGDDDKALTYDHGTGEFVYVAFDAAGTAAAAVAAHVAASDPHTQYELESNNTAAAILTKVLTVDGAGSGLDADLLDGNSSAFYLPSASFVPGGSTTQVQYNNAGVFAGDAGMTYDAANDRLTVAGGLIAPSMRPASDSTTALQLQNAAGTAVVNIDTTNRRVGINGPADYTLQIWSTQPDNYVIRAQRFTAGAGSGTLMGFWEENNGDASLYMVKASTGGVGCFLTAGTQTSYIQNGFFALGQASATALLDIAASSSTRASLRIREGVAPTSPNNGDFWYDGTSFFLRSTSSYSVGPVVRTTAIRPISDSTTALQLQDASGTAVVTLDTTNKRFNVFGGLGSLPSEHSASVQIAVDATGTAFILALSSTEYTRFVSGGAFKGMISYGSVDFTISSQASNIYFQPVSITGKVGIGMGSGATALLDLAASTTVRASLRIREAGTRPTTPNSGDFWNNGAIGSYQSNATTNAVTNSWILERASSGTPAAGFGLGIAARLESSTTEDQDAGRLTWEWVTATDASRASRGKLSAYSTTTEQEAIRWDGDSGGVKLGFYGVTTTARQVLATGAGATVDDVITALQTLGLVKQS